MEIEEVIKQLESIADHTERMLGDPDADEIWEKDIDALKFTITALRSMQEAGEYHFRDDTKMVPLSLEQLSEVPHGKIKDSTLQNIANRANEIASPPAHIDRRAWTAEWIYPENEWNLPRCSKCGCNSKDATHGHKNNFCPKCGRAMTPEAWAELERRLRLSKPPEED